MPITGANHKRSDDEVEERSTWWEGKEVRKRKIYDQTRECRDKPYRKCETNHDWEKYHIEIAELKPCARKR